MKDTKKVRTITFNILVVLTLVFIYLFFFPKKSYVKEKIDKTLNPLVEETFKENMNNMKIAGMAYFESKENGTITVEELMNNGLIAELKDSNNESCNTSSYIEKMDDKLRINLNCKDKSGERFVSLSDGSYLCIYQYEKKIQSGYTDWSNWSEWQLEPVTANDLTNIETEIRKESDGKQTVTETKEESIAAKSSIQTGCNQGTLVNGKCKILKYVQDVKPYRDTECQNNTTKEEYVYDNGTCKKYNIYYTNPTTTTTYYCPEGYRLSGSTCYKTVQYDNETETYKDVTYYRYQTREKIDEKIDIKLSVKDDQVLLNDSYNMVRKVSCES